MYRIKILTSIDSSFINEWKKLWDASKSGNIFNSYEWFHVHSSAYEYKILACYKNNDLVSVWPLIKKSSFGVKCLVSPGQSYVGGSPILYKSGEQKAIPLILEQVKKENICITNIDEDLSSLIKEILPNSLISLISVNPYIDLETNYMEFMSKSNRKEIRKTLNSHSADFKLKIYEGKDLKESFKNMVLIEQKSSKKTKSMDVFSNPEDRKVYESLVENCKEHTKIAFLFYKNEAISYQFGFLSKGIFYAYQTAFLNKYRNLNPGRVMLYMLFEKLAKDRVKLIDLGGGISSYKQSFTPKYFCLYDFYYSRNPLTRVWWKGINLARRRKQILFPKAFTRDHEFLFKTI